MTDDVFRIADSLSRRGRFVPPLHPVNILPRVLTGAATGRFAGVKTGDLPAGRFG